MGRFLCIDLEDVSLWDYEQYRNFISSCSLLVDLTMWYCVFHGFEILDISSASMKNLDLNRLDFRDPDGDSLENFNSSR